MKKIYFLLIFLATLLKADDIKVEQAYIVQTPPNAKNTAIYLKIYNNKDKDIALIAAKSSLAKAELHNHIKDGAKMSMMKIEKIGIKAHSSVELEPGGMHVMLFDLKQDIKAESLADLELEFDDGSSIKLDSIKSQKITPMQAHKH